MPTSTRSGPSIIVGGPGVATALSATDRVNYQLILSLGEVSGNVSWLTTLEAKAILRTEGCSVGRSSLRLGLPLWWRRQTRCDVRGSWCRSSRAIHVVRNPDTLLLSCARGCADFTRALLSAPEPELSCLKSERLVHHGGEVREGMQCKGKLDIGVESFAQLLLRASIIG